MMNNGVQVKLVIPFDMIKCGCGRTNKKGDRVRATKREIGKDPSLEVEIYRFEVECPCCRSTISIRTDPGGYDYILEAGATLIPNK